MDNPESILRRDYSDEFDSLRKNSIIQSHYKYGWMSDTYPELADAFGSLEKRVEMYRQTGNADWLVDIANFAMIEFMHPKHPLHHFRRTGSDESPGLDGVSAKELMESVD
jgi:hypothetical protein